MDVSKAQKIFDATPILSRLSTQLFLQAFHPSFVSVNGKLCTLAPALKGSSRDHSTRSRLSVNPFDQRKDAGVADSRFTPHSSQARPQESSQRALLNTGGSEKYLRLSGNTILDEDGNPVTMIGVNWAGFEEAACMLSGWWAGDETLTADFATAAYRIQLLGFTTVRMPFSFPVLFQSDIRPITKSCKPSSLDSIIKSTIDPADAEHADVSQAPHPVDPPQKFGTYGVSNDYVSTDSVYTRFLYVVGYLARQGFYIIIDNHSNVDPTIKDNPGIWREQWSQLMQDIIADPVSKSRVLVDILNEPDSQGLSWEDMGPRYLEVMQDIHQFSPHTLFLIEGMGQMAVQMNWGDGFVTSKHLIDQYGLDDPRPFFNSLLEKPFLNNVIISPHIYPPSITGATDRFLGVDLRRRLSMSWGYLATKGYGGHVFPVIIGETGSKFETQDDLGFYQDFLLYLRGESYMHDEWHAVTRNLLWWSWNANSDDTGGLLDDSWRDLHWDKYRWLMAAVGLQPWYDTSAPSDQSLVNKEYTDDTATSPLSS